MSAAAAPYQTGDKVLAYHGPRLYPAKIIEVDTEGTDPRFFIHYEGWKRKWVSRRCFYLLLIFGGGGGVVVCVSGFEGLVMSWAREDVGFGE